MTATKVLKNINLIIRRLIELGIVSDYQTAISRGNRSKEITFGNAHFLSEALKDKSYPDIYKLFCDNRVFNMRLIDGSLVQLLYWFSNRKLLKHRLAYLPAPSNDEVDLQSLWEIDDQLFRGFRNSDTLPIPMRFDFDVDADRHVELTHSKSHLTLGNWPTCRIPISAPLTPYWFILFLLQHFVLDSESGFISSLPNDSSSFSKSITAAETSRPYLVVP